MALGMRVNRIAMGATTKAPFNWQAAKAAMTTQQSCQTMDDMLTVVIARTMETAAYDLIRGAAKKAILEASAEMILTLVKANGGSIQNILSNTATASKGGGSQGGDDDPNKSDIVVPVPDE